MLSIREEKPAHSTTSILPQFTKEIDLKQVYYECREVVWLRTIHIMTSNDLKINDPVMLAKFKALLILQAHELFFLRQSWETNYLNEVAKIFTARSSSLFYAALSIGASYMFFGGRDNFSSKGVAALESYKFNAMKFFALDNIILPGENSHLDVQRFESLMNKAKEKFYLYANDHITAQDANINQELSDHFAESTFFSTVLKGAKKFDINHLNKIKDIKQQNVFQLCIDAGLSNNESKRMVELRKEYIHLYEKFIDIFYGYVGKIKHFIPDFSDQHFSDCYTTAFNILDSNTTTYLHCLLYEIYLQQRRKPSLQKELSHFLQNGLMPLANTFLKNNHSPTTDIEKIANYLKDEKEIPLSLHEIVDQAYTIFHAPSEKLQKNPCLHAWTENTNKEKNAEIKSQATDTLMITNSSSTLFNRQLIAKPLFPSAEPIPGALNHVDKHILMEKGVYLSRYQTIFYQFQYDKSYGRALINFEYELTRADCIEKIAALVEVAKPYVNKHQNALYDTLIGKQQTTHWKTALHKAREKAWSILEKLIENADADTTKILQAWYLHPLFAEHKNDSVIYGAWGRTSTQIKMDDITTKLSSLKP